jgi:hypothetical protein
MKQFEREFLIRLAPVWLACRWRIMGHALRGRWPAQDLAFDLLGCCDYGSEMRLLCYNVSWCRRRACNLDTTNRRCSVGAYLSPLPTDPPRRKVN